MTLLKGQRVLYLRYGRRWPAIVLKVTEKRIVIRLVPGVAPSVGDGEVRGVDVMTVEELKQSVGPVTRIGAVLVAAILAWKSEPLVALCVLILAVTGSC